MNMHSEFGTRYPFHPYPTGWFAVGFSAELPPGGVRAVRYFGREMVLFRTESGEVALTDAHCPHLGAHLGHEGRVEGETIVCPFHQWRYAADGRCVAIPFAKAVPAKARVRAYPTAERGGLILMWHDLDDRAPLYQLPIHDEGHERAGAGFHVMHDDFGGVHPQDAFENGVDIAHFPGVHSTGRAIMDGPLEMDGHVFRSPVRILPAGYDGPLSGATDGSTVQTEIVGGGLSRIVSQTPHAPGVTTIYYVSVTPVDEALSHYYVRQFFLIEEDCTLSDEAIERFTALAAEHGEREQWSDGKIWPHKAYVAQPLLSAADGPILRYREWYRQFHPRVAQVA